MRYSDIHFLLRVSNVHGQFSDALLSLRPES